MRTRTDAQLRSGLVRSEGHESSSPGFWARLRRDRLAFASLIFIVVAILLAAFGPAIYSALVPTAVKPFRTYNFQDYGAINSWPSQLHWLGADALGRDTLARLLLGLRVSLLVAAFVQFINI